MGILIRLLDWVGRAFDLRDLLLALAGSSIVTGGSLYQIWDWFKMLPGPVSLLFSIGLFFLLLAILGYVAQKIRKPVGPFLFDAEHLLKSVLIHTIEVDGRRLSGPTPHLVFSIYVFNGSGFPIYSTGKIEGRGNIRGAFLDPPEIVDNQKSTITYPGSGVIKVRQFIGQDVWAQAQVFANSGEARFVDKMFGEEEDYGPSVVFNFNEVGLVMTAAKGRLTHEFKKPLGLCSVRV